MTSPFDDSETLLGDRESFTYLLRFARPLWGDFIVGTSFLVVAAILAMFSARLLGVLIDQGILKSQWDFAESTGFLVVVLETSALLSSYLGRRRMSATAVATILIIRNLLLSHLAALPMAYFDRTPQGRVRTRLTNDVENLEEFFSTTLARLMSSFLMAIAALIAMIYTVPLLGGMVVVSIAPALWLTLWARTRSRKGNREIARRNSILNTVLSEFVQGLSLLRVFGIETWATKRFESEITGYVGSNLELNRFISWQRPLTSFLSTTPLVLVVAIGGHQVLKGLLAVGVLVSFVRYYERFGRPLMELSYELHTIQQAFTSAERLSSFLHQQTELQVFGSGIREPQTPPRGEIVFSNVHMSYSADREALRGVSFHIRPGERIGITGPTGSGKTTTISLLLRLYPLLQGEIRIDGVRIEDIKIEALRGLFGFVSQEVMIVKGSVRDNLLLTHSCVDEVILETAKTTGFFLVMEKRGLSLDSPLTEFGLNLSVGERQLLSFTRILLTNPKILILDEATSNIDAFHEQLVQAAAHTIMQGRTCLSVAHRLSTLSACDRILVFKEGRLEEEGSHADLIARGAVYYELARASEAVEQ